MIRDKRLLVGGMVLILSLILGCAGLMRYGKLEKSARQYYQKGCYDSAVFECAKSLRQKPGYAKAQALINDAFRAAVNAHGSKIKELKLSTTKFKWDDIVSEYEALIKLNQVIRDLPTLRDKKTKQIIKFKVTDYTQDLTGAKKNAAEAHYQEGLRLSKKEGIDVQKQAAKEFKTAEYFIPGYKDATRLYEECRRAGTKRMAIIPFKDKSGKRGRYGAVAETLVDEIISNVMNDPGAIEFLELISRDQLEQVIKEQKLGMTIIVDEQTAVQLGKILGAHEILTGKITQIIYNPAGTTNKRIREEATVVVKTEKYRDSEGHVREKDVYGKVYATVRIYTRTTSASIRGSYRIIDVETAKLKKSAAFNGKADFKCEWAKFSGDERALSRENERLCQKNEELAPVEEEMVSRALHDLGNSLAETIKEYTR